MDASAHLCGAYPLITVRPGCGYETGNTLFVEYCYKLKILSASRTYPCEISLAGAPAFNSACAADR